jgi:S-formylglutathione hydrolase FrmB
MNIDLFGQSLLVSLCIFSIIPLTYLVPRIKKELLPKLAGLSLLLALILQITTAQIAGASNELPSLFWLMVLPFTLSLCLPVAIWKSRKLGKKIPRKKLRKSRIVYAVSGIALLSCLALSIVLMNGYYHFYPTLYSALGIGKSTAASLNSNGQVILQYAAGKQATAQQQTLESSIYGSSSAATNGKLYSINIPGTVSKFRARSGWVYAPAIAVKDDNTLNLPVLVLLAGTPGAPSDWLHGMQMVSTLNAFAKQHHGITPLVFVVDATGSQLNDTECVNSPRGNAETYLTVDVPRYIQAHFPVSNDPANWGIGGLSMGGMCGVMLTLAHPNVYHYFLDIGGEEGPEVGSKQQTIQALFGGSAAAWAAHQPDLLLQQHTYNGIGGFFASGKEDSPLVVTGTKQLYSDAKGDGLDAVYETVEGEHTFDVFAQIFKDALPWISNRLGATSCTGATTCS